MAGQVLSRIGAVEKLVRIEEEGRATWSFEGNLYPSEEATRVARVTEKISGRFAP